MAKKNDVASRRERSNAKILTAARALSKKGEPLTYRRLRDRSKITSMKTVERAVARLVELGAIRRGKVPKGARRRVMGSLRLA